MLAVRLWITTESPGNFLIYISGSWTGKAGTAGGWPSVSHCGFSTGLAWTFSRNSQTSYVMAGLPH